MSANHVKFKIPPELIIAKQQADYDALQKKHTTLEQAFEVMYTTLRTLSQDADALRERVGYALAALRGFPASMQADDIPDGCPGWGMCDRGMPPCQHCPHQEDCFFAGH